MKTFFLFLLILLFVPVLSYAAVTIDISAIIQIESSGNPNAVSKDGYGSIGLMQISSCVLAEWNQDHPHEKYSRKQLFNPSINKKIGTWYITVKIPHYCRAFKKPVTIENLIIGYNAGISYLKGKWYKPVPQITKNYIRKYYKLSRR